MPDLARTVPNALEKSRGQRISSRACLGAVATAYYVLLLGPWRFSMPASGLDPSWVAAIAHGFVSGWQWGSDVIFTFGPLGFLYFKPFLEGTLLVAVLYWTVVAVVSAVNFLELLRPVPLPFAFVLFVAFAASVSHGPDTIHFILPLLAAIGHFRTPHPVPTKMTLPLAIVTGPAGLIKLSFGILGAFIFVVLDVDRVRQRKFPLYTPVFLATFLATYVCVGQNPAYLYVFLVQSFGVVSGFSEAQQLPGSNLELLLFMVVSAATGLIICYREFHLARTEATYADRMLFIACLAIYWIIIFKAGFVRQDLHTVVSWNSISACMAAYLASNWPRNRNLSGIAAIVGVLILTGASAMRIKLELGQSFVLSRALEDPLRQLTAAWAFLADRDSWMLQRRQERDASLAAIRRATPLSPLDGSVDTIPSIQSAILAYGFEYRPRPNLQEYEAYTRDLIDANLTFLRSDRAPKYIVHSTGSIDNRYPSLADGPMWPDLLSRYYPLRFEGKYLILRRRPSPIDNILSAPLQLAARIGEEVKLDGTEPKFVAIQTRKTLFGRLAQLLFRPGLMSLTVKLSNGQERIHRIVPDIAKEGFFLSPLAEDNFMVAALSIGHPELFDHLRVVAFRVDVDAMAAHAFDPTFEIQIQSLQHEKLQRPPPESEALSQINAAIAKRRYLMLAASSATVKPPYVSLGPEQLFAHAPAKLSIPAPGSGSLRVGFGIRDGAWRGSGRTDGVCFRVSAGASAESTSALFERCLRPLTEPRDRGEQRADVRLGAEHNGRIFLETDCAGACTWDWSYWSDLDFAPQ
jgi:hypothetical protein